MISCETLESCVSAGAEYAPLLHVLYRKNAWLLQPMLDMLDEGMLPEYLRDVDNIWHTLRVIRSTPPRERINEVVGGLQFHSMEFLKLQIQFAKTGHYRSSDAEAISREIYQVDDKMWRYLDGLLLSYVAWPNHYRLLRWYRDAYLSQGPFGQCLEIGPGHGFLALEQLLTCESNRLTALDISPHSVDYTRRVLEAHGINPSRYDVRLANVQEGLDTEIQRFDRIVLAEVIEHVADPASIIRSLVDHAHRQTLFFVTTVVNVEAPDHIYLFRTLQEVRGLLDDCGLVVRNELAMPLKMNLSLKDPAYEVAFVCTPRAISSFDTRSCE